MLEVAFVGMGRVGLALSLFFLERGVPVKAVYSRSQASRNRARRLLKGVLVCEELSQLPEAEVVFITVSDSAIAGVASALRKLFPKSVLVHTSGAHPSSIIPGEGKASFHPLQSLSEPSAALGVLAESLFTLEGDEKGLPAVVSLARTLGVRYVEIDTEAKPLYHAAAVVASNYLVTLMYHALEILKASGFPVEDGMSGLVALSKGTLFNVEVRGVPDALTGPIARGDWETVKLHLEKLKPYPELERFYRVMGEFTSRMLNKEFKA
jgi:predicted short-subunit dehydrogenase-like oxidoreductase (DUF2520 family)